MPSQSQYIAETPAGDLVPKSIVNFFERFYKISDSPDQHEEYAGCFTEDGVMVLASSRVEGRKGILALRPKMWEFVSSRSHHPLKIFPFGRVNEAGAEAEVMIYGTVEYGFKAGGSERKEWAVRAELVKEEADGEWNWAMRFYQVYLDTGAKK